MAVFAMRTQHDGIIIRLKELPRAAILNADAPDRLMGRHMKTIQRSVRRGELPAPFIMGGRQTLTAGAILDHFEARPKAAIEEANKRRARLEEHHWRPGQ